MTTAITLFKERGYHNVSINELCRTLNITRSAFYYYFKTKDEILDTFILYPDNYIVNNILPYIINKPCQIQLYTIINSYIEQVSEIGPELMQIYYNRGMEGKVHYLAPRDTPIWKYITEIIRNGQKTGEILNTEETETLAESIIYTLTGIGVVWCNKNGNFNYYAECTRIFDFLMNWKTP